MVTVPLLKGCYLRFSKSICIYRIIRAVWFILLFMVVVPLLIGLVAGIPFSSIMALIIATLALQAAAGVVGLGFSIHPLLVLVLMTSIALAIIMGILEVCDLFAEQSTRIQGWIQRIDTKTKDITYLRTYGALMLIPIIWIPGIALYGTPLVAWIFRWKRGISIFCMITGWMIATGLVMGTTLGLVNLFF